MRENAPQSREGRQVWDLAMRCGHQLRVSDGRVIGFDFNAVRGMGADLGVSAMAVAEFFPGIEAAAVVAMNEAADEQMKSGGQNGRA